MKYVVLSLMVIFSVSCGGNKNPNFLELEEEDIAAKELLQGIWLDGIRFTRMEMIRLTTR